VGRGRHRPFVVRSVTSTDRSGTSAGRSGPDGSDRIGSDGIGASRRDATTQAPRSGRGRVPRPTSRCGRPVTAGSSNRRTVVGPGVATTYRRPNR
jgi:hypothetical protein